jgi:signal transduction histidine kinase
VVRESFERERAVCEADPASFRLSGPGETKSFAFDAERHVSGNPTAPPFDEGLFVKLGDEADAATWRFASLSAPDRVLIRVSAAGPCALLQIEWAGHRVTPVALRALGASGALSVVGSLALGLLFVAWPLARRTRRLLSAANQLGEAYPQPHPRGPVAVVDDQADELDIVLASLVAADVRIRADGVRLAERSRGLERHLADVAHDVRTPLLSLQLAVEQARNASDDPAVRELLAGALSDAVFLEGLTENLRLRSLLEDGWAPQRRLVDLVMVVERLGSRAAALARHRGIDVAIAVPDVPLCVSCDEVAVERAVGNVVDNAVAHGEPGGHVALLLAAQGDGFEIVVLDDGPGIAEEQLARLSERGFRADEARQRDSRGSGLGLSITAELCARSGFSLRFETVVPRGLRVVIAG